MSYPVLERRGAAGRGAGWLASLPWVSLPLSGLYQAVSESLRRARQAENIPVVPPRVISIGNIEVGGNGKTPFAIELVRRFRHAGLSVAFVSRGVGGTVASSRTSLLAWPDDTPPLSAGRSVAPATQVAVEDVGDEGMVAVLGTHEPCLFGANKAANVAFALEHGFDRVVVDDAFQTWKLPRDLDVVMLDATRPFANRRVIPAGPLREEPGALLRADAIGFNNCNDGEQLTAAQDALRTRVDNPPPSFGVRRKLEIVDRDENPAVMKKGVAVTAIARPEQFETDVQRMGVALLAAHRFPDHYWFNRADIADWERIHAQSEFIVTQKDWVKIREFTAQPDRYRIAQLSVTPFGDGWGPTWELMKGDTPQP